LHELDAVKWEVESSFIQGMYARPSLLVHVQDAHGRTGVGEIAPLPGISTETLEEAYQQLLDHFDSPLPSLWPSVWFGVHSALADLEEPPGEVICLSHALLMGENVLERAERAHAKGIRIAKLKIGERSDEEAHGLIAQLKDRFSLRLDVNRKWSLSRALRFFSHYDPSAFEYTEEPIQNPQQLSQFPYPFALDETLQDPAWQDLAALPMCAALILKPTLLGDVSLFLQGHRRCILSHCFEGPVGRGHIAKLAKRLKLLDQIHGLDPLST
jgi:O-succinylbenzoate synthase